MDKAKTNISKGLEKDKEKFADGKLKSEKLGGKCASVHHDAKLIWRQLAS